ncbi:RIP metalloprotease RseP [Hymenobacter sp. DH14]|uniref:Zinc metalloprotease n=1 Tax=Hymenobacter cyanobacteriorum TaxID=2926463 RepID=A0A9X1VIR3_9BACT|nr:RIP metalloprotease RseP [Hymenobacter cyanobacteriorum]MCI1189017.1 RIP metalloprotease RseP [Hymenobacter cyanobacteriorum]
MAILTMIGQLVLALSILVGLHEFGHFAFAKLFKIRVDKFYIFFDFLFPMPNVANFALVKKKIGETEYGIGWFPLGGYVQIHGMIDETQDASALAGEPQPDEFRGKPAWQRLLVMLGGIIMNVILGIVIFTAMTAYYGETYLPASSVKYGVLPNGLARQVGFQTGDKIVKINGRPFKDFDEIYQPEVLLGDNTYFTVERGSQLTDVKMPDNFLDLSSKQTEDSVLLRPRETFAVDRVTPGGNASKAGLQVGDVITAVSGQPVQFFDELQAALLANKDKTARLDVQRAGQPVTLNVPVDAEGHIGFERKSTLDIGTRKYSLAEALPRGAKKAFSIVWVQARAFGKIFTGKASAKNLGGPVEIAQQFGGVWDWQHFWGLAGILSMVLAFMNLLPVPALDGGHVVFLLYEMILRRKPSDAFLEGAQRVGTVLILALMAYVIVIKQVLKFF